MHAEPCKKEFVKIHQSYEYHCVKDHEEEGGGNVGEPGDHDRLGICDQFFFYVVQHASMSA